MKRIYTAPFASLSLPSTPVAFTHLPRKHKTNPRLFIMSATRKTNNTRHSVTYITLSTTTTHSLIIMARYTIVVALLALLSITRAMALPSPLENHFNSDDAPKEVVLPSTTINNATNKVVPPPKTEDGPIVTVPDPSRKLESHYSCPLMVIPCSRDIRLPDTPNIPIL